MADTQEGAARRLARIQAISGLTFSLFLALHLANTALAALGPALYDGFQRGARTLYQAPLFELVAVAGSLVVHVAAGVMRARLRGPSRRPAPPRARLQRLTGLFLALVMVGHIGATRGASLVFGAFPEFAGLSWALSAAPWFFFPYYALLAVSGLYHGAHGLTVALGVLGVRVPSAMRRGPTFWLPVSGASILLVVGVLALGGALFPVADASSHPYVQLAARLLARLR